MPTKTPLPKPAFRPSSHSAFAADLRTQAQAYLEGRGDHRYGNAGTAFKAAALATLAATLFAASLRAGSGLAFAGLYLGFYVAAVLLSTNTLHDASHGALFASRTLNAAAMRAVAIVLGFEPVYWKARHVRYHHPHANIEHCDLDTASNPFLRQTPFQRWLPQFRFQHLYWPLVAALSMPYIVWVYDWSDRLGWTPLAKDRLLPGLGGWMRFALSKLAHLVLCLGIPALVAGPAVGYATVIAAYLLGQMVGSYLLLALILGTHWAETHFYDIGDGSPLPHTREEHALLTCCDWLPRPRALGILLGGLHLHATHHLFPMYSHRHYPELAHIVEQLAGRHGLPYRCLGYSELIAAQQRFLKAMGQKPDHSKT
jgi:linoleoyl-CoA desaturase